MANRPITMSKLRRVLKLHFQGKRKLQISTATGLARNTVKKYITTLQGLKTTWEELTRLEDKELDELFSLEAEPVMEERLRLIHEFFLANDKHLRRPGMTLGRLYLQYAWANEKGYKATAFYRHYNLWKRKAVVSMHLEHTAGDKVFVDFTGHKLPLLDQETGVITEANVFVAILPASQLTYVEAVSSQRVEDFIMCCQNALRYIGGSPAAIVPDNLKAAVIKSSRYEPQLNENFEAFADHYGMTVLPARAYRPKDKALVEGAVKIAYMKIFAELPQEPAESIEALNRDIAVLLEAHNTRLFKGRTYSRRQQFEEMEQHLLQDLPELSYELRRSLAATALKNGHVCLSADKHYYSIPYAFISRKLRVVYSASRVEIFYRYELIANHARSRRAHSYTTLPGHLASHHQAMAAWNPEFFLTRARAVGPHAELLLTEILNRRPHPEQAYKSCQGILSFASRVGHDRLERACRRAQLCGLYTYRAIADILERGLDAFPEQDDEQRTMPEHGNIRGKDYYAKKAAAEDDVQGNDESQTQDPSTPDEGESHE